MKKIYLIGIVVMITSCSTSWNKDYDEGLIIDKRLYYDDALKADIKYSTLFDSLTVIPLDTIGGFVIGNVKQVKISNHYIAVLDKNSDVFIYNHDGKGVGFISRKGQGAKEYIDVRAIDVLSDSIVCLLTFPPKLMYFKADGQFISEHALKNRAYELGALANGKFVLYNNSVSNGITDNASLLEIYNSSDETSEEFLSGFQFMNNQLIPYFQQLQTITTVPTENELLFTHSMTNNIYAINESGVKIKYLIDFKKNNPSLHYPSKMPAEENVANYLSKNFPVYGFNACWENDLYLHCGGYVLGKPITFLYNKTEDVFYSDFYMQDDLTHLTPFPIMATNDYLAVYYTVDNVEMYFEYLEYSGNSSKDESLSNKTFVNFAQNVGNPIIGLYHLK